MASRFSVSVTDETSKLIHKLEREQMTITRAELLRRAVVIGLKNMLDGHGR